MFGPYGSEFAVSALEFKALGRGLGLKALGLGCRVVGSRPYSFGFRV